MNTQETSRDERDLNQDYLDTKIGRFNKDPSVATIYVGNLDYSFCELDIKDLFEKYGYVNYVKLVKDKETHKSKGIAFVQMAHGNQAKDAIKSLDDSLVEERRIKVSIAQEQDGSRVVAKTFRKRRKPYKAYISKAERAIVAH